AHLLDSADRCRREQIGSLGVGSVTADRRERDKTPLLSLRKAHEGERGRTIGNGRGICRRYRTAFAEGRPQRRYLVDLRLSRLLVLFDDQFALSRLCRDGDDLFREAAIGNRLLRLLEGRNGK